MMLKKGDYLKHFKGKTLTDKNIYEVLEMGVTYSGDKAEGIGNLVVYKNIRQEKIFARELEDLLAELPLEKQQEFGQKHRVEILTEEEKKSVMEMLEEQEG